MAKKAVYSKGKKKRSSKPAYNTKQQKAKKAAAKKENSKAKRAKAEENYDSSDGYTQDLIPIRDIKGGIIRTTDGRSLMIMEVLPVNFYQKTVYERNTILNTFAGFFNICPSTLQFKTVTSRIDTSAMIDNLEKANKNITNPRILAALRDYIHTIRTVNEQMGILKQYYIIFQYEGTDITFESIQAQMYTQYYNMKRALESAGNIVPAHEDENMFLIETLYKFYNRRSAKTETAEQRRHRVTVDMNRYCQSIGQLNRPVQAVDIVAPRGVDFRSNKDFCEMDGLYYTYAAISDTGYPEAVYGGWLDVFSNYGVGVDIDFFMRRVPKEITMYRLERRAIFKRVSASEKGADYNAARSLMEDAGNSDRLLTAMRDGEELYNCSTIFTIWGNDPKEIMSQRQIIRSDAKAKGMAIEESHLDCINYFKMTAPLLSIQSNIFSRTAHNFLTSTLPSIYNYTVYQMFDPTGYQFGINMDNGSLVAINNFNTKVYKNGNMLIIGTTGAGKSFTEMFIGRKQFLSGMRTYYILPEKGYEYKDACKSLDGTYVELKPGSPDCINIMEIRPEMIFNADEMEEADEDTRSAQSQSLLAKKITSLTVWIQLLLTSGDRPIDTRELNRLNFSLVKLYNSYGITDDNDSIYDTDGYLKRMPVLGDLYNLLLQDPLLERLSDVLLPFVAGSCQNMNRETNVDLSNRCIVFDVDESVVGEDLLAAFLYIAFDCAYDLVKADADGFDTIVLDEVWKMMGNAACARQVQKLVKLIRGYAGAVIIATQDIHDFLSDSGGFGVAVINNTKIKFIMQLENDEIERVGALMRMTQADAETIRRFERGCGMLFSNDNKVRVQVKASEMEIATFTTDLNVKRMYREKARAAAGR